MDGCVDQQGGFGIDEVEAARQWIKLGNTITRYARLSNVAQMPVAASGELVMSSGGGLQQGVEDAVAVLRCCCNRPRPALCS